MVLNSGSITLEIALQFPAADIITVPGDTTSPSGYFCFMESESFPVGTLIPRSIANSEIDSTALYKRASSPSFLQGHIQLAESEILCSPSFKGAQIIFVSASVIATRLPALGSISAAIGACPIEVAIPSWLA